jgi:hypothetical protein
LLDRAYEYGKRVRVWPSKLIQQVIKENLLLVLSPPCLCCGT